MSEHSVAYLGNTLTVSVTLRLTDGPYVNNATVTLDSVLDEAGSAVAGIVVPLALTYVPASNGLYEGSIPAAAAWSANRRYRGQVTALLPSGAQYRAEEPIVAMVRRA